tara:strand:+ start:2078 stop:2296 length:219 start_codon:yes stop_codon:yes gene_type:complete
MVDEATPPLRGGQIVRMVDEATPPLRGGQIVRAVDEVALAPPCPYLTMRSRAVVDEVWRIPYNYSIYLILIM